MTACWKCNGKGTIRGFEHIENGKCFACSGTGKWTSRKDRIANDLATAQRRADAHDSRMAREQGVSLEDFRAYVGHDVQVPKHENGCSFSLHEFVEWRAAQ